MRHIVRDLALRTPVTVSAETAISEAELQLIQHDANEVFVTDAQDRLLGSIPASEFLNYRLLGGDGQGRSAALMTPAAAHLTLETELPAAARLLRESGQATLPVISGERIIGVLSRTALLRVCAEQNDALSQQHDPLNSACLPPPKWSQPTHRWNSVALLSRPAAASGG